MRPRAHADLLALVRVACTHASRAVPEIPALPFYVREHIVGWLRPSLADRLRRWPHFFETGEAHVVLRPQPDTPAARTEAMAEVTRALEREGAIPGWRDEPVSVAVRHGAPELLRIERAASRPFGLTAYGAHLNAFTRIGGLTHVWVARRSERKAVDPGKLDNLVGGRISAGMSVDETLRKESWEEAGLAPALLADLSCVGAVRVEYPVPEGLHREILFVHDLWLPNDFTPVNQDGEVAEIRRMPVEEVVEEMLAGSFTLDAAAVMVDGLLRLGAIPPEDPQYLDLLRMLKP